MSPFSILSPSNTFICLVLGIRLAHSFPDSSVIINLSLPLVGLPQDTIPLSRARIAASLGFLASNKSATLGRPPVISLVFADSCETLAITLPNSMSCPSFRPMNALPGRV